MIQDDHRSPALDRNLQILFIAPGTMVHTIQDEMGASNLAVLTEHELRGARLERVLGAEASTTAGALRSPRKFLRSLGRSGPPETRPGEHVPVLRKLAAKLKRTLRPTVKNKRLRA